MLLGILVGVLPGLGAPNGVSLLLPLTFTMDPVSAIILLTSMYWGALFGGSTTSILFNIPGEPSSVATTFDGYPMAQQGQATKALTLAFLSAGFGALVGVDRHHGPVRLGGAVRPQLQLAGIFRRLFPGLRELRRPGRASPFKTVVSMMLGFAFAAVGMDTMSGSVRLTFGFNELVEGISFLVAVIGLFGLGELLLTMEEGLRFDGIHARISPRDVFRRSATMPRYWVALLRSALIGCWMGITPGGPTAASFMSYGLAKRFSRRKERLRQGRAGGRHRAGDRRPLRRHLRHSADAGARHSRARRPPP